MPATESDADAVLLLSLPAMRTVESRVSEVEARVRVRGAIVDGKISDAIEALNAIDSDLLEERPELLFALRRQQLLNIIAESRIDEAISFAREKVVPLVDGHPERLSQLEEVMALLAFTDRKGSPLADLLGPDQRAKTAERINAELMERMCGRRASTLNEVLLCVAREHRMLAEASASPTIPPPLDLS